MHVICFKLPPQEPYLSEPKGEHETEGGGFCDSVWRVEPTVVQETEANLVATVYNAGKVCCTWGGVKFGYWGYKIQTLHVGIMQPCFWAITQIFTVLVPLGFLNRVLARD